MELAVQDLKMKDATEVIEYDGEDPYQMFQVHDYLNVKFLRMDPSVRTATKKVIDVFATAYPELLREKYFVNVPAIMGWMFTAMKLFLSRNTTRKFHPITNGANLAREFSPSIAEKIPRVYGGRGSELKDNATIVPLIDEPEVKKEEAKPTEPEAPKEQVVSAKELSKGEAPKEAAKGPVQEAVVNAEFAKEDPVKDGAQ
jgi:hypothetical protein